MSQTLATRKLRGRYVISAFCRFESPVSIGGATTSASIDSLVVSDGLGRPLIPATSLAGVLGAELKRHLRSQPGQIGTLFGGAGDGDAASRLIVDDALLEATAIEVRAGVGIDRFSGAAATNVLYNREFVAAGSTTEIRCEVVDDALDDDALAPALVATLATIFRSGFAVGAATTKGFGRVVLVDDHSLSVRYDDFGSKPGMLAALRGVQAVTDHAHNRSAAADDAATEVDVKARWSIAVDWQPDLPLLPRSSDAGETIDAWPAVTACVDDPNNVRLVLPGTSVRGVFRSHAERIVRTVAPAFRHAAAQPSSDGQGFIDQVDVPLVTALFGRAAQTDETPSGLGRGAVTVLDTCNLHSFPRADWESVVRLPKPSAGQPSLQELSNRLRSLSRQAGFGERDLLPAMHLAVDRWTSGTVDGALYSALEVRNRHWEPIQISVDLERLETALEADTSVHAALFLLLLVVRDFANGWLPLGHATHRGHGSIEVDRVRFSLAGTFGEATGSALPNGDVAPADFSDLDVSLLQAAWTEWVAKQGGPK